MIAIAGAKGGCGKTTTALGLAQAIGRAGNPTIAVDADRHLPNLHVAAHVDREPTIERVDVDGTATDFAQQVPDHSDVAVLPAPKAGEAMQTQLRTLSTETADIVLDCPSGARSDLADPLSVADAVVVVTTTTDESLTAAAKTIDIARRLDATVVGTVLTKCDTVPTRYDDRIDAPVLATIPDVEQPLETASACTAFDGLASALASQGYLSSTMTVDSPPDRRLETGIDALDRALGGGLPTGSVVAYRADAASQSELLLYELTSARRTLFLTTERSVDGVLRTIESTRADVGRPTVRSISDGDSLEEVSQLIEAFPNESNVVIDTVDLLEYAETAAYVEFLNRLDEQLCETDSLAFLHCLKGPDEPDNRTRTEHCADAVFDLRTDCSGAELENHLSIPKLRCGGQPTEAIKLEFTDGVEIDTSRDIA
ncbi:DUF7125 family protein [Halostagnicola bangensis]